MAAKEIIENPQVNTTRSWIGTAAEKAALDTTNVADGSTYIEVDAVTKKILNYYKLYNSEWFKNKELFEATGGSNTTIQDTARNLETNILKGCVAEVIISGKRYVRTVKSNTADTITIEDLPGEAAEARLGSGASGQVTIVCKTEGRAGNSYTVVVQVSEGNDMALSASFANGVLTVYLGTNAEGAADNTKNTATLVATEIAKVPEFNATQTGADGSGVIEVTTDPVSFEGGVPVVSVSAGDIYTIEKENLPTTPILYHIALTSANTEYSKALPPRCKKVFVYILDGDGTFNFRVAFETGKVATPTAPYLKYLANYEWESPDCNIPEGTLYIACSSAGKTAVIECWT